MACTAHFSKGPVYLGSTVLKKFEGAHKLWQTAGKMNITSIHINRGVGRGAVGLQPPPPTKKKEGEREERGRVEERKKGEREKRNQKRKEVEPVTPRTCCHEYL